MSSAVLATTAHLVNILLVCSSSEGRIYSTPSTTFRIGATRARQWKSLRCVTFELLFNQYAAATFGTKRDHLELPAISTSRSFLVPTFHDAIWR